MSTLKCPHTRREIIYIYFIQKHSAHAGCSLHPTLALMMVGRGSKMPCIFLKAGITKRLQVTTADTGFPRTEGRTERGHRQNRGENIWVTSLCRQLINHSFSQLHTLPGRAKISLRAPSMSKVANVVGRLKKNTLSLALIMQCNNVAQIITKLIEQKRHAAVYTEPISPQACQQIKQGYTP